MSRTKTASSLGPLPALIFSSRWLQLPLYLGLIVAQGVYVFLFVKELWHLILEAPHLTEQTIMLIVLGLIDVVMISNLLVMVIVGGYETFVSRLNLAGHPDQPEWLSHVNASVLKVKLAMAIIGISSIHLLKTFIEAGRHRRAALVRHDGRHGGGTGVERRRVDRQGVHDHHGSRSHVANDYPQRFHSLRARHRLDGPDHVAGRAPHREPLKPPMALRLLPICEYGVGCDAALQQFLPLIRPSS